LQKSNSADGSNDGRMIIAAKNGSEFVNEAGYTAAENLKTVKSDKLNKGSDMINRSLNCNALNECTYY